MPASRLLECAFCSILIHAPAKEKVVCPECDGALARGQRDVGFADAARIYGTPTEPHVAKHEEETHADPPRKPAKLRCDDGHRVRSKLERTIDDWLHANGILHELEPRLVGMRPDWRVGNVYIECWGMSGQQGYEARREEKLALYRKRKLKLVEVFPEDVEKLEEKLGFLRQLRPPRLV
jgi:hypothetical protein